MSGATEPSSERSTRRAAAITSSARIKPGNIKVLADEVIAAARLVERSLDGTVARAAAKAA